MKTYKHSGKIGDIIWALPFIIQNGGAEVLYLELTDEFTQSGYDYIYPLLTYQSYIKSVQPYNGEQVDFDLDKFRGVEIEGVNLAQRYFHAFNQGFDADRLNYNFWLETPHTDRNNMIIITRGYGMPSRQPRNQSIDYFMSRGLEKTSMFVGLESEYQNFCKTYNCNIGYFKTDNALEMAVILGECNYVIGNQTSTTAIAESLKKTMFLEVRVDGGADDCKFTRPNLFYI